MDDIIDVCQHEILRCSRIAFRATSFKKKPTLPFKGPHYKKQPYFEPATASLRYTTDNSTTNSTCSLETTLEDSHATPSYSFNLIQNENPKEYNYFSNSHLFHHPK
ncbi:hypothetical protein DSO57_1000270 [Entomophthora muscae]|uniref:Uncharacterized protein n=1 Tax=Entomophthora muscae TaxID=34485 RepID=A0ACC2SYA9_9FUNG|nr:hypothetical protein DSO57_1000270 [Entomophthora muscae]